MCIRDSPHPHPHPNIGSLRRGESAHARLTIMITSIFLSMTLAAQAYAAEIQMGKDGMLVFAPCELTINAGESVTFVNNELPPHNVIFADHSELSHNDLAFSPGESWEVTFEQAGDYNFQCDPHAGAGMKGVIHVQ